MNRAALLTVGRKLQGDNMYLLSVFDLEPSGVIVHAYNQADSKEYILPITELELAEAKILRTPESLTTFLGTIYISDNDETWLLQSSNPKIKKQRIKPTGAQVEELIKSPSGASGESIHELLITGLVALCKAKPVGLDAVQWLGEWLLANNPNKPRVDDPDDL